MTFIQALLLGILQGATEFLPVSSSAHLVIFPHLLGWPDPGLAFDTLLHLGTLAAVVVYFRRDLWQLIVAAWDSLRRRKIETPQARLAWLLILPTVLIVFGIVLFPAVFSVWISFHDVGLGQLRNVFEAEYVGLDNYRRVIDDFAFKFQGLQNWGAAVTSVVYSFLSTVLTILVGLVAALVLNRRFVARGAARAIFLFPYVAPVVSVAFVWRWLLDPRPSCLLYTSDAADDLLCVDLGGRRIIKKQNTYTLNVHHQLLHPSYI